MASYAARRGKWTASASAKVQPSQALESCELLAVPSSSEVCAILSSLSKRMEVKLRKVLQAVWTTVRAQSPASGPRHTLGPFLHKQDACFVPQALPNAYAD